MDSLIGKRSPKAIRVALRTLQKESKASIHDSAKALDQAYEQAMKRIEGQVADSYTLAKQVLSWITCAWTPLTTLELRHALAVEMNESELDEDNLPDIEDMVSVCAGLVTIDQQSDIIRLVHYTAQEYFERTQELWFPNAQNDLTRTCVTYLSFDAFETGFCPTDQDFEERLHLNPLYRYAAQNWGGHAYVASQEVDPLIVYFLDSAAKASASSQALWPTKFNSSSPGYSQTMPRHVGGVHLCAYFGLERVMTILLKDSHNLCFRDAHYQTPLSWAAEQGHEPVVKLLPSMDGIDANYADLEGWTPFFLAAMRRHNSVVKLLRATNSIDTCFKNEFGLMLLKLAATDGKILASKMLAVVVSMERDLMNMEWAAREQYGLLMKWLIEKYKIDLNKKDELGRTLLSYAVERRLEMAVRLLLLTDAVKVNVRDKYGRTPMWWAGRKGHTTIIRLLAEKYGEKGMEVQDDEMTSTATFLEAGSARIVCDVCESWVLNVSIHYHCGICAKGDFDICQECVTSGAICLDHSHKLIKRIVKDGNYAEVPD
jgi:AraC-like DNA-binding protein